MPAFSVYAHAFHCLTAFLPFLTALSCLNALPGLLASMPYPACLPMCALTCLLVCLLVCLPCPASLLARFALPSYIARPYLHVLLCTA
jgi:hypothetical protein